MKNELQNILAGKSQVELGTNIQAIGSYLWDSKRTGTLVAKENHYKKQEEKFIKQFCDLVKDYFFTYCKFTSLFGHNPKGVLITEFLMEAVVFNQENTGGLGRGEKVAVEIDDGFGGLIK